MTEQFPCVWSDVSLENLPAPVCTLGSDGVQDKARHLARKGKGMGSKDVTLESPHQKESSTKLSSKPANCCSTVAVEAPSHFRSEDQAQSTPGESSPRFALL